VPRTEEQLLLNESLDPIVEKRWTARPFQFEFKN